MGEIADDIMNGIMCQVCGGWMEDMFIHNKKGETIGLNQEKWDNPPGHPRSCNDCVRDNIKKGGKT